MTTARRSRARWGASLLTVLALSHPQPASAQAPEDEVREVTIDFTVGDFDADRGDWGIEAVTVAGDIDPTEPFTVLLSDEDGDELWSGTAPYEQPSTTVPVDGFVAVGDVTEAAISQSVPAVAGDVVTRQDVDLDQQGNGQGNGGQLALSMVLAVIMVAILFRSPLPAATTQRWRR